MTFIYSRKHFFFRRDWKAEYKKQGESGGRGRCRGRCAAECLCSDTKVAYYTDAALFAERGSFEFRTNDAHSGLMTRRLAAECLCSDTKLVYYTDVALFVERGSFEFHPNDAHSGLTCTFRLVSCFVSHFVYKLLTTITYSTPSRFPNAEHFPNHSHQTCRSRESAGTVSTQPSHPYGGMQRGAFGHIMSEGGYLG
jgi:hypothetical protein